MNYLNADKVQLEKEYELLSKQYEDVKGKGLKLNMARGKPGNDQLEISKEMLNVINSAATCIADDGTDCRNYGNLEGITESRELFAQILQVEPSMVMVGGNSSLNMMFDSIATMMTTSVVEGEKPWYEVKDRKFLCPVPGYDRHFSITEYFGFEMITVPMTEQGPDMDVVEKLVESDSSIKGMWCVPKYSNPQGITYSDETVKRIAALKPKAKDFRVIWDNAYAVHDVTDTPDTLLNIMDECKKTGNEDLPVLFCSTSKITFPGSGVAAMAASENNMKVFLNKYKFQTIGFDKMNMHRHMLFFKDYNGVLEHMKKHKEILKPKFEMVISKLEKQVQETGVATWANPNGGYFVSVDVLEGTADRVVGLCKEAGVVLTGAGATYPYGKDPKNSNIRIAPSYPPVNELADAMDVFCVCTKLAASEKLLNKI
ncbi:MAG: aminotransferase class I/II-fold pyridoxal phosphate-dependent enzyme [Ruminococcus sp.]|nr:aminotransferase class I/II-fold pyridoxal phosphate-dependent enzyme [Ruminococcus sp.]